MPSFSAKISIFFIKKAIRRINPTDFAKSFISFASKKSRFKASKRYLHRVEKTKTGAVIERISAKGKKPRAVVYLLHGGAYLIGQQDTYRKYAINLIKSGCDVEVALIDYRVSPNLFPAALEDAFSGFLYLLEDGYSEKDIILHGDSAGGNLALALSLKLKEEGRELPKAAFLLSPWTDMTMSGDSYKKNFNKDPFFGGNGLLDDKLKEDIMSSDLFSYFKESDKISPLVSPLFGDYKGMVPVHIVVGGDEMLLDDSIKLAKKMEADGVLVKIDIYEGMFHVFPLFDYIDEAKEAQKKIFESISKLV